MIRRFERTVFLTMQHATFALTVVSGVVTEAPPIARWAVGEPLTKVIGYYRNKYPEMEWRTIFR